MRRAAVVELVALLFLVGACALRDWLNMAAAAVVALLALVEVLRELAGPGATVTRSRLPSRQVRSAEPMPDDELPPFAWLARKTTDEEPPRDA